MKHLKFMGRVFIPTIVWKRLEKFVLDKRTGNVTFNIKDGHVVSATVEDKGAMIVSRVEVRAQL